MKKISFLQRSTHTKCGSPPALTPSLCVCVACNEISSAEKKVCQFPSSLYSTIISSVQFPLDILCMQASRSSSEDNNTQKDRQQQQIRLAISGRLLHLLQPRLAARQAIIDQLQQLRSQLQQLLQQVSKNAAAGTVPSASS
jgi:hypothetical protein